VTAQKPTGNIRRGGVRISQLLKPHWKTLTIAFLAVIIESLTDLLDPWPLKLVLDSVLGSRALTGWLGGVIVSLFGPGKAEVLNFAAVAVMVIAAAGALSSYTESYLATTVGQRIMHDLRTTVYHHIQRLSLSFYDQVATGDLISRVTNDIDAIQSFVSGALLGVLVNTLTLVGMLGVMFYLNWRFTLIALSVAPVLFLAVYTFTHRIKSASRAVRKKESEIVSTIQEVLTSMRVVKAFAREDYEERRFEQESLETVEVTLKARGLKALLAPMVEIIVAGGTCLVLWYGTKLVLSRTLTTGALVVFLLYLAKMYKPMRELSKMTDTVSRAAVGFERIKEVLEVDQQVKDLPMARPAPPLKGKIEFHHVFFSYNDDGRVLRDINLSVEPGQVAALVGPTGAGKSTIISLIPRLYDPTFGQVMIDGFDVRTFRLKSLRRQFSFVLQETLLFHATIAQNIAYGKPDASDSEIVRAARLANAEEFIVKLPRGYGTMVGERGVTLSGGQRQRVAIARAIIRNSPILILDEPTSGLDAGSEQVVFDALAKLMENKTCVVIAHRLATITRADVIFVVDEGKIVERGTHRELVDLGGLYSQLYEIQFRTQTEEPALLA
jgi:ATP-binding cassette subfamily B protein